MRRARHACARFRSRRSVLRIRTSARACGPRPAPRRVSLAWSRRRSTYPAMTRRRPRLTRSAWRRPAAWTTTRARWASSPAASCRPGGSTRSVSSPSGAPGVRQATTVPAPGRGGRYQPGSVPAPSARGHPPPRGDTDDGGRSPRPRLVRLDAVGRRAGREGGRLPDLPAARGGTGCPSLLVPVFLEEDTTTVCDRVTVTTADETPVGVRTVASRTRVQGAEAEFETAWESFGAPEDVDTDPKPLVVVHSSLRPLAGGPRPATVDQSARAGRGAHRRRGRLLLCHVLAGPPPRSLALRVRDVEPRGGDALRGRALHPPPGAGRRARHARRSRVTPAPPDAPPTGAVCGAGVASVDALYDCAAGGRLSGASVGGDSEEADQCVEGAAPRARRVERVGGTSGGVRPRPGRRRAEGPAARVSAGRSWPVSSSCPSSSSRGPSCVTRAPPPRR